MFDFSKFDALVDEPFIGCVDIIKAASYKLVIIIQLTNN